MSYKHGVYVQEIPTSISSSTISATVPVVFGTAQVNLSKREQVPVNEPILCFSYKDAVEAFGYSDDYDFTLNEFIYSHFALFGESPAILVNVLDPTKSKTNESDKNVEMLGGLATVLDQGVIKDTVVVKSEDGTTTYEEDVDFVLDFDMNGNLVIQKLPDGTLPDNGISLSVSYDKLDPSKVTSSDLIGGVDEDGNYTGLELLNQVFPRFRIVPGMVLAPGYSHDPIVAAVMTAKAGNINSNFKCLALTDISTEEVTRYTDAPAWKEENNYNSSRQVNGYPKLSLHDKRFHMSTQLAGVICATDRANGNIPYVSPSNQNFRADGAVLADGSPVFLGPDQAAFLNGHGIVTALNFIGGWKAWGNRTGAFPGEVDPTTGGPIGVTDPKDTFIPVRRMFDWIINNIILTYWRELDAPISRRLVEAVTDSLNLWLNGLSAQGAILGGRVEFNASENSEADLMDGIIRFHVYVTPPSPAREIDFVIEYDAQYLNGLFG